MGERRKERGEEIDCDKNDSSSWMCYAMSTSKDAPSRYVRVRIRILIPIKSAVLGRLYFAWMSAWSD